MTEKDVKVVEFASYGAMWKGLVNNDVDAAYGTTITGPAKEVETSPRGLVWPPTPADDKAGWARLQKITPFINPHVATCGAGGISKDKPAQLSNYPYPIYTVYANQKEDDVYMLTKAMIEGYDAYKDNAPGATGMAVKPQTKNWSVPVHKGAVKALKEAGAWSDDQEKFNNDLFKRQETLAAAWADLHQGQSAGGRQGIRGRLDEGARRRAVEGGHAERLLIEASRLRPEENGDTHVDNIF